MSERENPEDRFSKLYFHVIPWTVPVIVASLTSLFLGVGRSWIWIPLLFIYWGTIWSLTLYYRRKRGGVFQKERFRLTLKLKGERTCSSTSRSTVFCSG